MKKGYFIPANIDNYNVSVVKTHGFLIFLYSLMTKAELLKKLGTRIREIREAGNMTQANLAHRIGKDQQSVQRLEAGNINPSFYYLNEIAEGLNVKLDALITNL